VLPLVPKALLAAVAVESSLRLLGFRRTLGWVERMPSGTTNGARTSCEDTARAVAIAYRLHPLQGACLGRSMTRYALHRRDGAAARLVVGVRRGPSFQAHAWIESRLEDDDRTFVPLLKVDTECWP
jgi:hypothetical protein